MITLRRMQYFGGALLNIPAAELRGYEEAEGVRAITSAETLTQRQRM